VESHLTHVQEIEEFSTENRYKETGFLHEFIESDIGARPTYMHDFLLYQPRRNTVMALVQELQDAGYNTDTLTLHLENLNDFTRVDVDSQIIVGDESNNRREVYSSINYEPTLSEFVSTELPTEILELDTVSRLDVFVSSLQEQANMSRLSTFDIEVASILDASRLDESFISITEMDSMNRRDTLYASINEQSMFSRLDTVQSSILEGQLSDTFNTFITWIDLSTAFEKVNLIQNVDLIDYVQSDKQLDRIADIVTLTAVQDRVARLGAIESFDLFSNEDITYDASITEFTLFKHGAYFNKIVTLLLPYRPVNNYAIRNMKESGNRSDTFFLTFTSSRTDLPLLCKPISLLFPKIG
jgi:hypothetical protein